MPKTKYYWVLRGARGQAARDKYLGYLQGLEQIEDNIGQGAARPASVPLYLEPFSLPLATAHVMKDSATQPAWNTLSAAAGVSTRVTATLGTDTAVDVPSYKAPRIVRVELDTTGVREVSKFTGLPYLKYDHTSLSIPFGRGTIGETVAEAFSALVPAVAPTAAFTARLINERY